jgi:hypothetical protein
MKDEVLMDLTDEQTNAMTDFRPVAFHFVSSLLLPGSIGFIGAIAELLRFPFQPHHDSFKNGSIP